MPYVDPEIIAEVKRVDLLTYLQEREPDELVRISPGVYCTKEHDSLKISNGKWFWWSRDLGGRSALDFLVKVRDMAFLDAVEHLRADRPAVAKIPARACRPTGERAAPGVSPPTPVRRRRCDAVPRIARHLAQPAEGPRGCRRRLRHHARRGRVRGVRRAGEAHGRSEVRGLALVRGRLQGRGSQIRQALRVLPAKRPKQRRAPCFRERHRRAFLRDHPRARGQADGQLGDAVPRRGAVPHARNGAPKLPLALAQHLDDRPYIASLALHLDNDEAGGQAGRPRDRARSRSRRRGGVDGASPGG